MTLVRVQLNRSIAIRPKKIVAEQTIMYLQLDLIFRLSFYSNIL